MLLLGWSLGVYWGGVVSAELGLLGCVQAEAGHTFRSFAFSKKV